jgi:hypothetical protein
MRATTRKPFSFDVSPVNQVGEVTLTFSEYLMTLGELPYRRGRNLFGLADIKD